MQCGNFYVILIFIHFFNYLQCQANESPWKRIVEQFAKETKALEIEWEQLKIKKTKLTEEKQNMQMSVSLTDVIRLNVGGEIMMTTRASLTCVRTSVLAIIFNGRWEEKLSNDLDQNLFLDFDPTLFRQLLQQLRSDDKLDSFDRLPLHSASPSTVKSYTRMLKRLRFHSSLKSISNDVFALNVGGQSILIRQHRFDSMKLALLLSRSAARFIDADPQVFRRYTKLYTGNTTSCLLSTKDSSKLKDKELKQLVQRFNSSDCLTKTSTWTQDAVTVAGFNRNGTALSQLFLAYGIDIDDEDTLFVADYGNDRIVKWKKNAKSGEVVVGGIGRGNRTGQLNQPIIVMIDRVTNSLIVSEWGNRRVMRWSLKNDSREEVLVSDVRCFGLALGQDRSLYVSDQERHEVRRYRTGQTGGTVVAGGHGNGSAFNQLNGPRGIFVDDNDSVYIADTRNHRVIKWTNNSKEGIVVAGGQGNGNSSMQLSYPAGLFVDSMKTVYVAEDGNDRVTRWFDRSKEATVIVGGNGRGSKTNQFHYSEQLTFDRQGNLYVADHYNHRIQRFNIIHSSSPVGK